MYSGLEGVSRGCPFQESGFEIIGAVVGEGAVVGMAKERPGMDARLYSKAAGEAKEFCGSSPGIFGPGGELILSNPGGEWAKAPGGFWP